MDADNMVSIVAWLDQILRLSDNGHQILLRTNRAWLAHTFSALLLAEALRLDAHAARRIVLGQDAETWG